MAYLTVVASTSKSPILDRIGSGRANEVGKQNKQVLLIYGGITINMSMFAKSLILLRTVANRQALIALPKNGELLCRHVDNVISSRTQLQSTLANKCDSTCVEQSNEGPTLIPPEDLIDATDPETLKDLAESFRVYRNFVTEDEEKSLFDEVEPYLKRLKYETSHWDDVCSHLCYSVLVLSTDGLLYY